MAMRSVVTENVIFTLEEKIAETRATLEYFTRTARGIKGRLLSLETQRNSFKNQIAPISSLPNELLGAIFEYGHLSSLSLRTRTRPPIEMVLSHVNQRFRDVAMNTRLLWTRIEVFIRTHFNKVVAYFQRSRTYPFDLYLDIDVDDVSPWPDSQLQPDSPIYTNSEWRTIISYMTRCREFSVRSNDLDVVDHIIVALQTVNAPLLRSLKIKCPYADQVFEPHGPYRKIVEGGAPALTAVWLEGLGLHQCLPPLTRVTSLTLLEVSWGIKWSDLRDILRGSLALTCLAIGDIFAEDIPINFESSIILPSLQSLYIFVDDHDGAPHIEQILVALSAPVLETLAINNVVEIDLVDVSQLQNSDRFPYLRYLSVSPSPGEHISQASWTLFCSVFPRIVRFALRSDVYETAGAESLITALGYSPDGTASTAPLILPELHTLSFSHISEHTSELLCGLVSTWHAAGWPLRLLQLPAVILHHEAFAGSLSHLQALIQVKEYEPDGNLVEFQLSSRHWIDEN